MTSPLMGEACPVQSLLRRGRQRRHLTGERGGERIAEYHSLSFVYRSEKNDQKWKDELSHDD